MIGEKRTAAARLRVREAVIGVVSTPVYAIRASKSGNPVNGT